MINSVFNSASCNVFDLRFDILVFVSYTLIVAKCYENLKHVFPLLTKAFIV